MVTSDGSKESIFLKYSFFEKEKWSYASPKVMGPCQEQPAFNDCSMWRDRDPDPLLHFRSTMKGYLTLTCLWDWIKTVLLLHYSSTFSFIHTPLNCCCSEYSLIKLLCANLFSIDTNLRQTNYNKLIEMFSRKFDYIEIRKTGLDQENSWPVVALNKILGISMINLQARARIVPYNCLKMF